MSLENMDKPTILKMVREGWQAFEEALAQFDDAQMAQSHPPDGWSVLDMMVHVSYWETFVWKRLQEVGRGEKPDVGMFFDDERLDQVNQEVLEAGRTRALDEVKAELQRVHQGLLAELEQLPDTQDETWWGLWPKQEMAWQVIFYSSADHYAQHLIDLKKWLENA